MSIRNISVIRAAEQIDVASRRNAIRGLIVRSARRAVNGDTRALEELGELLNIEAAVSAELAMAMEVK